MSEVRQVARLIVLFVLALVILSCARPAVEPDPRNPPNPIRPFAENPCAKGTPRPASDKQAPIVCIDDSERTLKADPDRVVVHESRSSDRSKGVGIQWYTVSGTGDVHVKMDSTCDSVSVKGCASGKCDAETVPGKTTDCKYDVWITGGKHDLLDPTVIVDPCCT